MKYQPKSNEDNKKIHTFFTLGYSRKKQTMGGWGYGISRAIKEIECGIYRGGWPRKNYVEFTGVLVIGIGISKGCNTVLHNFQVWSFDLSGIFQV